MTEAHRQDDDGDGSSEPTRRYRWRYGPLRLVMPWLAGIVGVAFVARGIGAVRAGDDPLFIWLGAGLVVLAVVFFLVYRRQAKRGF